MVKTRSRADITTFSVTLMYAGLMPFGGGLVCLLLDLAYIPVLGETSKVICIYGLIIATFILGSQWGLHLFLSRHGLCLSILSNALAIGLWLGFLVFETRSVLFLLGIVFMICLAVEWRLFAAGKISAAYFKSRSIVTILATISLVVSGILT